MLLLLNIEMLPRPCRLKTSSVEEEEEEEEGVAAQARLQGRTHLMGAI
jgi:hypothetical protein